MNLPSAILFDWDNTLVSTMSIIQLATEATFKEMGSAIADVSNATHQGGKSMREFFQEKFGERWQQAGDYYRSYYKENRLGHLQIMPASTEMLEFLHQHPAIKIGAVSNKFGPFLREEVEFFGWGNYFASVVGSQDAEFDKPHPAPVYAALAQLGVQPDKSVWFVGDSVVDMECAKRSGVTPILYDPDQLAAELATEYSPLHVLRSHNDLVTAIRAAGA